MDAAIRPTVTQEVRAFFVEQGVALEPWSGLDETLVGLYQLLALRRDDPAFWPPLAQLLRSVVEAALDPDRGGRLAAPEAELLRSWDIDRLVDELRAALPGAGQAAEPAARGVVRLASRSTTAVLGGFLLLGLAAAPWGCSGDDAVGGVADASVDARGPAHEVGGGGGSEWPATWEHPLPWWSGCSLDKTSALYAAIEKSSLKVSDKFHLCVCFQKLSTSWSEGLTELFQTQPPSVVARVLETMVRCCRDKSELAKAFAVDSAALLQGQLQCNNVPIYKGVMFPHRVVRRP
jgi:hypothetical protein